MNRIDKVVVFRTLTKEQLTLVLEIELRRLQNRITMSQTSRQFIYCLIDGLSKLALILGHWVIIIRCAFFEDSPVNRAGAAPVTFNQSGVRKFCSIEDGVIRYNPGSDNVVPDAAACTGGTFNPLNN